MQLRMKKCLLLMDTVVKRKSLWVLTFLLVVAFQTAAVAAITDTSVVMSINDYYRIILSRHPVVLQTATFSQDAKAQIRMAKGMLDPGLSVDYQGKTLSGTEYYQLWDNTLKIPVWFGTDFKVGYERNTGQSVNGESSTPSNGLWYAGVSVPLGQGLFIDERRNAILQAKTLPALAEADRIAVVNAVLLKATNDYWDWHLAWKRYQLWDSAYVLAETRFQAVKARASLGELPWIDTVEARVAVLDREILRAQAFTDYKNAMLNASVHLWAENEIPLELTTAVVPQPGLRQETPLTAEAVDSLVAQAKVNHPDIVKLGVQQQQLAIEERYQRDRLKPKFNLNYNILAKEPGTFVSPSGTDYYRNNYKLGFQFSYPLLLRKERGKLQRVEIKQMQVSADRQQKERELSNSIRINQNNWLMLESQVQIQTVQVGYSRALRDAEQTRFFTGESSFFLVNTRELALVNSEIRLYELQIRLAKTQALLYWSAGSLIAQ